MRKPVVDEIAAALRTTQRKSVLVLVLIDLDQFIYMNDSLGFAAGDEALQTVQNALFHVATESHANLQRVGGDEFLLSAFGDGCSTHRHIGQNALQAIRDLAIPMVSPDYDRKNANLSSTLTCSVSALSFPVDQFDSGGNLESSRQVDASIVESLLNLCYSMVDGAKLSGRAKLLELNLCGPCA